MFEPNVAQPEINNIDPWRHFEIEKNTLDLTRHPIKKLTHISKINNFNYYEYKLWSLVYCFQDGIKQWVYINTTQY